MVALLASAAVGASGLSVPDLDSAIAASVVVFGLVWLQVLGWRDALWGIGR